MIKITDEELTKIIKEKVYEGQEFKTYAQLRSTLGLPKYAGKDNIAQKNRLNRFMQIDYYPNSYKLKIEKVYDIPIPPNKGGRKKGSKNKNSETPGKIIPSKIIAHILLQINSTTCKLIKSDLLKQMGLFNFYSLVNNNDCKELLGNHYSYFLLLIFRWNSNFLEKGLTYLSNNKMIRVEKTFSLKERDLTNEEWNNLLCIINDLQRELGIYPKDYIKRCNYTNKNMSNYTYLMKKVNEDMKEYYNISPFRCIKIFKNNILQENYSILSKEELDILQKQLQELYIQKIEKSIKRKILKDDIDMNCEYMIQLLNNIIHE